MSESYFSAIPSVGVEITNRCNLHCRHCFNHSGENRVQELSLGELIGLFDQIVEMGGNSIRISGGEPTLHPDFVAIITLAKQRELQVSLNSHGVYGPRVYRQLADLSIDRLIISLDGLQTSNDHIRGHGVFQRVVETVSGLRAAGQSVMLGVHLRRSNQDDIHGLVALAAELGCNIKFSPLRPLGRARQYLFQDILRPVDFYRAVQEITRLRAEYSSIQILTDYDVLAPAENLKPPSLERAGCPAGRSFLNINYDGYVYPCAFLVTPTREFAAGNIHAASLLALWRESPVFQAFRVIEKDARCHACPVYRRTCVGGCVAMSYFAAGRIDAHDPTCFIEHVSQDELRQMEQHRDPL
jgi:radical SAM protein with 4Fe4S-binding SPASM domain